MNSYHVSTFKIINYVNSRPNNKKNSYIFIDITSMYASKRLRDFSFFFHMRQEVCNLCALDVYKTKVKCCNLKHT